jgi:hypothetical protein
MECANGSGMECANGSGMECANGIIIILYYKYTCVYYIECQIRENENSDGDG